MAVKLPKYAHWVAERRFLVDPKTLPPLDAGAARLIEDLYIEGGRLRLRRITLPDGEQAFKLAKKYAPDNPLIGPMANLYLSREEYEVLARLPGARVAKRRHKAGAFVVDVFEGPLEGLVTAECEATNRVAAMAFDVPPWCVREVTTEVAYTGWQLAQDQAIPTDRDRL
jgi:CYTH domain-containing protein